MKKLVGITAFLLYCFTNLHVEAMQLNLNPETDYRYEVNYREFMILTMEGSDTASVGIQYVLNFHVDSLDVDNYWLTLRFSQLTFINYLPTGPMVSTSEKASPYDLISTILSTMTTGEFKGSINKSGQIKLFDNLDDMISMAVFKIPNLMESQQNQFISLIDQYFGRESLTQHFELGLNILPVSVVKLNEKWVDKRSTLLHNAEAENLEYQIIADHKKTLQLKGHSDAVQKGTGEVNYTLFGEYNSDITLDRNSGWIIMGELNQQVNGSIEIQIESEVQRVPMILMYHVNIKGIELL